jgi:UDP-N-acetylglucosamine--N-acetylmuramyl-(pentapeptide) pyrophosphoryl-undecaprenol N-acetylglucosamine transferase
MAGGTGGHIFPGLAVANYLRNKGWDIHWLGSEQGMEISLVKAENIDITLLPVSGVRGKGILQKLFSPIIILRSIWQAKNCLQKISPDVVLGMGGFASGPGGVAARILSKPLVIHEQNAIAGYTNRMLSTIATKVLAAFPNAFADDHKVEVVGNPIRKELCQLEPPETRFEHRDEALRVLVVGGSRGAYILNKVLPEAIQKVPRAIAIKHQCGAGNKAAVEHLYTQNPSTHLIQVFDFIDDMADAFSWADIVVCRAGALTVSELMAVGLGALFVPYPFAVDDHQTANAQFMVNRKAAKIIQQQDFNAESCSQWLQNLSREQALKMAISAVDKNSHQVTARISNICANLIQKEAA